MIKFQSYLRVLTLIISASIFDFYLISCSGKSICTIEPAIFPDYDVPFLGAVRQVEECEFIVLFNLCVEEKHLAGEGRIEIDHKIFRLASDELKGFVSLLDLSKPPGTQYDVGVVFKEDAANATNISVRVDEIFSRGQDKIHQFRILKSFCYANFRHDEVIFVSEERGVIGSYISDLASDGEYVMETRGDCLIDLIDYSTKKKATLK